MTLLTWPVGPWAGPLPNVGIAISPVGGLTAVTLATVVGPVTDQRLVRFVPWSEIQKGLVVVRETPHGFTRVGSVMVASPGDVRNQIRLNERSGQSRVGRRHQQAEPNQDSRHSAMQTPHHRTLPG
jgi:hypothetical protein